MNKFRKWKRRVKEDGERRRARDAYYPLINKYARELSKFSFCGFGTALTLYRDGRFGDTDIDFYVYKKDTMKIFEFAEKNNIRILDGFAYNGEFAEIKLKYKKINVDFFIIDDYIAAKNSILVYAHKGGVVSELYEYDSLPKSLKFKIIDGLKVIDDDKYYEWTYGKNWTTPLKYTYEFMGQISEKRRQPMDPKYFEKCEYFKNSKKVLEVKDRLIKK